MSFSVHFFSSAYRTRQICNAYVHGNLPWGSHTHTKQTFTWTWTLHCIYDDGDPPLLQALVVGKNRWKLFGGFKKAKGEETGKGEEKGKGKEKGKGQKGKRRGKGNSGANSDATVVTSVSILLHWQEPALPVTEATARDLMVCVQYLCASHRPVVRQGLWWVPKCT